MTIADCASGVSVLCAKMVLKAGSGHIGMPFGMADVSVVLWTEFIRFKPHWATRDRFILSCGHGSALLYAILYYMGYLTYQDCMNFRQLHSHTSGHPEYNPDIGIEMTTGALGQGLAWGIGMARAEMLTPDRDNYTYIFCSDGDLMEGVAYEAISLATEWNCHKCIVFWDDNQVTIDGSMTSNSRDRIVSLFSGWNLIPIDGHNYDEIRSAIRMALSSDKPTCIQCKTVIGRGLDSQGSNKVHGIPPKEELVSFIDKTDVDDAAVRKIWDAAIKRGNKLAAHTSSSYSIDEHKYSITNSNSNFTNKISTRKLAGSILSGNRTGSADLGESTCMALSADYTNFGVREHAMIAIAGGMYLYGTPIVVATFLVFTDYARASIRLAALMNLSLKIIATHDSIFLGEDGPTHQPIEHLSSLRLIPNLHVWRPANYPEMIAAVEDSALTVIACSRQDLEMQHFKGIDLADCRMGGYIITNVANPDLTLVATGSEVVLALKCRDILELDGLQVQVVSMPCLEVFESQSNQYKTHVLSGYTVSIEAGTTALWYKYVDLPIGIDHFGVSAPMDEIKILSIDVIIKTIRSKFYMKKQAIG